MAKVKIQGNASGTGVLTVTAPNTSTDRTITLPDSTGTLLTADGDGSSLTGISSFNPDGAVTINESGASVDFRVETDSNANMLFVDGSTNRIGIGTATPQDSLHLAGHNLAISEGEEIKWIDSSGNKSGRIYTTSGDHMYFDNTSSNTNRLKIHSSGEIESTNAKYIQNGTATYLHSGTVANSTTAFYVDVEIGNSGGNVQLVEAIFSHHGLSSYGCALMGWYACYAGSLISENTISDIVTNTGGSWSCSTPTGGTLRVTKNAGTYAGGGEWFVRVTTKTR